MNVAEEKYRKAYEFFLKTLVSKRVSSKEDFEQIAEEYRKVANKKGVDFDDMMKECALWMKQCVPGGNKKWSLNMSSFDKKGFDKLFKYAPSEIISILKSGGQPLLNIFSDEYAKKTDASFSDLNPEVVEFYNNNSEELENEWQFKIDNMEDSDIEHKRKLRNSETAFFEFVEDKYFEQKTQSSSDYSLNNIPYLRKASIKEVLNSPEFLTEENVLKLLPNIESYSDVLDSRYTFLTSVPRYFIMQVGDKEILVNTEGYDYPKYMIRIESNKSQASKIVDGFVVQLESGLYFQKEIKRSILTTTDLDKAELYPLELNANNHMGRLGIKDYKLVKHSKDKTTSSVQAFKSVIASTDFYPSEDLSFDDLYSKLIEDGYNIKNKSSISYIVGDINSKSIVWVFKNGNSILLTRYAGNNPKFLIDYIYNKFEIIMEDEDIVEASTAHLKKETVHNLLEAKALIKESFSRGDEEKYNGTEFFTHKGEKLFKCIIKDVEYEMIWPNGDSTIVDVMSTSSIKNWYNDKFLPVLKKHAQGEYDPMMVSKDGDTVKVFTKMYKGSNVSGIKEAFKELGIEIMEVETNASSYRGYVVGKIPKDLDNSI